MPIGLPQMPFTQWNVTMLPKYVFIHRQKVVSLKIDCFQIILQCLVVCVTAETNQKFCDNACWPNLSKGFQSPEKML